MRHSRTLDSKVTPWTAEPWLAVKKQLQYNLFKNFNHPNKNTDFGLKNGFGFSFSVSSALFCMQIAQQRSLTFLLGFVAMYISRMMFIIIELCSYTKNLIMFHQLLYIELLVSRLGCCKKTNIHVQKGKKVLLLSKKWRAKEQVVGFD